MLTYCILYRCSLRFAQTPSNYAVSAVKYLDIHTNWDKDRIQPQINSGEILLSNELTTESIKPFCASESFGLQDCGWDLWSRILTSQDVVRTKYVCKAVGMGWPVCLLLLFSYGGFCLFSRPFQPWVTTSAQPSPQVVRVFKVSSIASWNFFLGCLACSKRSVLATTTTISSTSRGLIITFLPQKPST